MHTHQTDAWTEKWNQNFSHPDYVYGKAPNVFLKQELDKLAPQTILFAAEGEGRNAVYAAQRGWKVSAFDISTAGRQKALRLAAENGVALDYVVGELPELDFADESFDAIALIYAHFPANIKSVARRIASTADSLQPYLLSNFDLVTESFTLIAGIGNVPFFTLS